MLEHNARAAGAAWCKTPVGGAGAVPRPCGDAMCEAEAAVSALWPDSWFSGGRAGFVGDGEMSERGTGSDSICLWEFGLLLSAIAVSGRANFGCDLRC